MNQHKLFTINGLPDSGKKTFIRFIQNLLPNISVINYIGPAKKIAESMGWNGRMTDRSRNLISDIDYLWSNYNDGLIKKLINQVKEELEDYDKEHIFFISIRRPEQIEKFKQNFKVTTILINRPGIIQPTNLADLSIFSYKYDIVINNNKGLDELHSKAKAFILEYLGLRLNIIKS